MTAEPMPGSAPRDAGLEPPVASGEVAVALLRVLLIPILLVGERLVSHPTDLSGPFAFILAAGAGYALVLLVVHARQMRRRTPGPTSENLAEPFIDLALICALVYTSGGPFSQARVAFFALPLVATFRLRPRLTAIWSAVAVVAYVAVSLLHPALHDPDAPGQVLVAGLYLAWAGLAAIVLSGLLAARAERISRLADERRSLVRHALESESNARRRLAAELHDQPVQTLLVAGQELQEGRRGNPDALDRAEDALRAAVGQLRSEISELHSHVLDHAGLAAALEDLAQRWSNRTGIAVTAHVDRAATGNHDELVFTAAQELVSNAARHASARSIELVLETGAGQIELRVSDDGVGMEPAIRTGAVGQGQLGLATIAERVQALGGRLDVRSAPRHGTTAIATLPAEPPPRDDGRPRPRRDEVLRRERGRR
jgi:two-component system, NarL family, sensor kinase